MEKEKEKDPAFLMYSKDWLEGTADLALPEKAIYIDLLCYQHQRGELPSEISRLARLVGLSESEFIIHWEGLKAKFTVNGQGNFANQKLSKVVSQRSEHTTMRRITGTFGALCRSLNLDTVQSEKVKKRFNYKDYLDVPEHELSTLLSTLLTKWIAQWEATHGDADAIAIGNGNAIKKGIGVVGEREKVDWEFEKGKFISDTLWHETIHRTYKLSDKEFKSLAAKFLKSIEARENHMTCKELKKYFCNWYEKQLVQKQ